MLTRTVVLSLVLLASSISYDATADTLRPPAPFLRDSTFNQDPESGKLEGRLLRIKRPLFIVKNLARSLDFYVDVVGLEVYEVEPTYNRDPESLGYPMFNIPRGQKKRMATLNTSAEVRGMTLQEVPDMDIVIGQSPRTHTVLFETDDVMGIRNRAELAGFEIIEPVLGDIPASERAPRLRFVEFGIVDPDGHVVAFFQYFHDDAAWAEARQVFAPGD